VRVFRMVSKSPNVYGYEGLYQVVGHRMEKSSDGPQVSALSASLLAVVALVAMSLVVKRM
jgi:hypothetical protein